MELANEKIKETLMKVVNVNQGNYLTVSSPNHLIWALWVHESKPKKTHMILELIFVGVDGSSMNGQIPLSRDGKIQQDVGSVLREFVMIHDGFWESRQHNKFFWTQIQGEDCC